MGRTIFVSYSRCDSKRVQRLEEILDNLDHLVWRDRRLSGGQAWWQQILDSVRARDTFLLAVSAGSTRSLACQRELEWALALGKPVLPVLIGGDSATLPTALQHLQYVDFRGGAGQEVAALSRALSLLPPAPPLPEPEPERPGAPPAGPSARLNARLRWLMLGGLAFAVSVAAAIDAARTDEDAIAHSVGTPPAASAPVGGSPSTLERRGEPAGAPTTTPPSETSVAGTSRRFDEAPVRASTREGTARPPAPPARVSAPAAVMAEDGSAERLEREVRDYVSGPPLQLEMPLAAGLAWAWVDDCRDTDLAALRRSAQLHLALPARLPGERCEQKRSAIRDVRCLRAWIDRRGMRCQLD